VIIIATGAAIFHGSKLCKGSEVRINGVVHINTLLTENETVPIGWIAVGTSVNLFPPEKHDEIWEIQQSLNFPQFVYDIDRNPDGTTIMPRVMQMMTNALESHKEDKIIK